MRQYREALTRAYERDDPGAIGDIGYNLAVAQLRLGEVQAALRTVRETRAELERRRVPPPAELLLVHAAAAYRAGDTKTALASAGEILDRPSRDADTVRNVRRKFQAAMADDIRELVRRSIGRESHGFLSHHDVVDDVAVEVVLLDPA